MEWIHIKDRIPEFKIETICYRMSEKVLFTDGQNSYIGFCFCSCGDKYESLKWYVFDHSHTYSLYSLPIPDIKLWAELPKLPE